MNKKTTSVLIFPVAPMGAPRMTQSDKWAKRPVVQRYYAAAEQIRWLAKQYHYTLGDTLTVRFFLEMPTSWSRAKRWQMDGRPHQQRPDCDNLQKFLLDALTYKGETDDAHVWHVDATKYWTAKEGYIEVEV